MEHLHKIKILNVEIFVIKLRQILCLDKMGVVTLSPPNSEAGVWFPAQPHVGKLVVFLPLVGSLHLFIYLGFYVAFNTVQVISRRVVGRAEETST